MTALVTCPCCHGEKMLYLFEQEREGQKFPREPARIDCCHCQGVGEVDAGEQSADQPLLTTLDPVMPASLRRFELSRPWSIVPIEPASDGT